MRRWRGGVDGRDHLLIGALLLSLVVSGLIIALSTPVVTWLDVGSPGDRAYLEGFSDPERSARDSFRWSAGRASLMLPVPDDGAYRVQLELANAGDESRTLVLACGDVQQQVPMGGTGPLEAEITCDTDREDLEIDIAVSPVLEEPDSGRELGVAVLDARVVALDGDDRLTHALQIGLAVGGSIVGLALASGRRRGFWLPGVVGMAAIWLLVSLVDGAAIHAMAAQPVGMMMFLAGLAVVSDWRRAVAAMVVVWLTVMVWQPPVVDLIAPGRWSPEGIFGVRALPWLIPMVGTAGLLLASRRMMRAAVEIGAVVLVGVLPVATLTRVWSITVEIPDWTSHGAVSGALFLGLGVVAVGIGWWEAREKRVGGWRATLVVAALGVAVLGTWRAGTMHFNGDEPHYYVMARSIGQDGDLELLDDYVDPEYREATISPDGNIAVTRDFSANRYSAYGPVGEGRWWLAPSFDPSEPPVLQPASDEVLAPELRGADGSFAMLPALEAGRTLTVLMHGCDVESLWVGAVDASVRAVDVRWVAGSGDLVRDWRLDLDGGTAAVDLNGACAADDVEALEVRSASGEIVAMGVDRDERMQAVAGVPAGDRWFVGWPEDRYASLDVAVTVLLHNLGSTEATARILPVMHGSAEERIDVAPGDVVAWETDQAGGAGLQVVTDGDLAVDAIGRVAGAMFRLPSPAVSAGWTVGVPGVGDRDAGVWLAVVNADGPVAEVQIGDDQTLTLCGGCGDQILLASEAQGRQVEVEVTSGGAVLFGATRYLEQTGNLHFDLGLPLLGALPARIGPPWLVFVVPMLAGVAIAAGVYLLLRTVMDEVWSVFGGVMAALLGPVSLYAVRFYTDVVAAAVVIWMLVCWERGRSRPVWLVGLPVSAGALGLLHGRLLPLVLLGLVLLGLRIVELVRQRPLAMRSPRWMDVVIIAAAVAVVGLVMVAASQFVVALGSRDFADYVQPRWVVRNLAGMLADRNSGLLPFAPWLLLALFARRPLRPVQRVGLAISLLVMGMVMVRAGGWMTFGAPGRYLLTGVTPMMLLVMPAVQRLWRTSRGRVLVTVVMVWSVGVTLLLHWLPLAGYVSWPRYLIDEVLRSLVGFSAYAVFPRVDPRAGGDVSAIAGLVILFGLGIAIIWLIASDLWIKMRGGRGRWG